MAKWLKNNKEKGTRKLDENKDDDLAETVSQPVHEIGADLQHESKPIPPEQATEEQHQVTAEVVPTTASTPTPLSQAERETMIEEFMRNQAARAQKTIEKRKQNFISKLDGKREAQTEISVKRMQIKRLRDEIQERRGLVKQLKQEVKLLRHQRKDQTETPTAEVAA